MDANAFMYECYIFLHFDVRTVVSFTPCYTSRIVLPQMYKQEINKLYKQKKFVLIIFGFVQCFKVYFHLLSLQKCLLLCHSHSFVIRFMDQNTSSIIPVNDGLNAVS